MVRFPNEKPEAIVFRSKCDGTSGALVTELRDGLGAKET